MGMAWLVVKRGSRRCQVVNGSSVGIVILVQIGEYCAGVTRMSGENEYVRLGTHVETSRVGTKIGTGPREWYQCQATDDW